MAAVIGLEVEKIQSSLDQIGADQVDLANFNSPGQGGDLWPGYSNSSHPQPIKGGWCPHGRTAKSQWSLSFTK